VSRKRRRSAPPAGSLTPDLLLTVRRRPRPFSMTMTRRDALLSLSRLAATALPFATDGQQALTAMDPDFLRMWAAAAPSRPRSISSSSRIAPAGEPGPPLRIGGRLLAKDGSTPCAGGVVYAYHTDNTGVYGPPGANTWRLKGWATADADGRFQFDTVRPAPYPNRNVAAHVHLYTDGGVPPQELETLMFEGDPLLTEVELARSAALGKFRFIVPVRQVDGRQQCEILLRVTGDHVF
jgi:protocatechuate 3,4-dioxygenase, beta subunit